MAAGGLLPGRHYQSITAAAEQQKHTPATAQGSLVTLWQSSSALELFWHPYVSDHPKNVGSLLSLAKASRRRCCY